MIGVTPSAVDDSTVSMTILPSKPGAIRFNLTSPRRLPKLSVWRATTRLAPALSVTPIYSQACSDLAARVARLPTREVDTSTPLTSRLKFDPAVPLICTLVTLLPRVSPSLRLRIAKLLSISTIKSSSGTVECGACATSGNCAPVASPWRGGRLELLELTLPDGPAASTGRNTATGAGGTGGAPSAPINGLDAPFAPAGAPP